MAAKKRPKCEGATPLCSNQLVRRYSVNGSEKKGHTFLLCCACMVYIKRGGSKLKAVA